MALKALLMYTDAHPRSQEGLRVLLEGIEEWLVDKPALHIAASGGKLFLDGAPAEGQNLHTAALVRQLSERQISGFVIQRGVTQAELLGMLKILILKPAKLEEMGGVAKVMVEQRLLHISLSQTQYKEVREGEPQGVGDGPAELAAQIQSALPAIMDLSKMLKRWQEGLESALPGPGGSLAGGPGGIGEALPLDLAFLGPVAEEMGWGSGFPTAPQMEALRQALLALPGPTMLSMLGGLQTLPSTPPSLGMAFQALAPEMLGHAAAKTLLQGASWPGLKDTLFELMRASPQKQAMVESLEAQFRGQGLEPGRMQDLLRQMDWDNQSLDEKVRRATSEAALWDLSLDQRLSLLRDLLDLNRSEEFLQVLELFLEQLTSEDAFRRDAAARALAAVSHWMREPGLPLEAQGPLLQGLVAHFGWEAVPAIHAITTQALETVLACLVIRGEAPLAQAMIQEMEGLCAFLEDSPEWRGQGLVQLRGRLCAEDLMSAAVENLHRAEAEDMLTDAIPYFEFLGEPAARYLVATLGEEPDRKRRGRLLDVIRVLGPVAIPALQDGLHSPTWYLVRNTLNLMADMGDAGLLDEVVVCLRHADGRVRRSAVRALWKLGGPAGGKHLLACLPGSDPETQMEILFGLGQIQTPEAVPALVELAKNGGNAERLRIKTIETLGQISSPAAIPGLLELVRRKGRIFTSAEGTDIRIAAARALLAIGTPQAELGLRQVVADEPRNQDRDALQRILDLDAR
jgi:hypothetical protein